METLQAVELVAENPVSEEALWSKLNALFSKIPLHERWPGCMHLALRITDEDQLVSIGPELYIHNSGVEFSMLTVVPTTASNEGRELRSLSLVPAVLERGALRINAHQARLAIDLHREPFATKEAASGMPRTLVAGSEGWGKYQLTLNPEREPGLLTLANRQLKAVIHNAAKFRKTWQEHLSGQVEGLSYGEEDTVHTKTPWPEEWFPEPYVCCEEDTLGAAIGGAEEDDFFHRLAMALEVRPHDQGGPAYLTEAHRCFLKDLGKGLPIRAPQDTLYAGLVKMPKDFCTWRRAHTQLFGFRDADDKVWTVLAHRSGSVHRRKDDDLCLRGSEVGHAVKKMDPAWYKLSAQEQWERLPAYGIGAETRTFLFAQWLRSKVISVDGRHWIAYSTVATAATRHPDWFTRVLWRLTNSIGFANHRADNAIVPPTLRMLRWSDFALELPFSVALNAHWLDPRVYLPGTKRPKTQAKKPEKPKEEPKAEKPKAKKKGKRKGEKPNVQHVRPERADDLKKTLEKEPPAAAELSPTARKVTTEPQVQNVLPPRSSDPIRIPGSSRLVKAEHVDVIDPPSVACPPAPPSASSVLELLRPVSVLCSGSFYPDRVEEEPPARHFVPRRGHVVSNRRRIEMAEAMRRSENVLDDLTR